MPSNLSPQNADAAAPLRTKNPHRRTKIVGALDGHFLFTIDNVQFRRLTIQDLQSLGEQILTALESRKQSE
jgi:hypothetical protein